jgi:hypothetical protein
MLRCFTEAILLGGVLNVRKFNLPEETSGMRL